MNISDIVDAIEARRIRITDHADEETVADLLTFAEVLYSAIHGEIIEDYPTDRPYPSCLVFGMNGDGEPIHTVWAYNEQNRWAVLITVYRPDPLQWINWRERRHNQ
jgi:hypothetical protein